MDRLLFGYYCYFALKNWPLEQSRVRFGVLAASKESCLALDERVPTQTAAQALWSLTEGSQGIANDLLTARRYGYTPWIFVGEWRNIPTWSEFRCFMFQRELVGISQYDCVNRHCQNEIIQNAYSIEKSIRKFFMNFRAVSHLESVVFDVYVTPNHLEESGMDVTLIELNPFSRMTGPGLFNWEQGSLSGGDFDGTFRFV